MKQSLSRLKPYLRWVILGAVLFFLARTLKEHWQEVTAIRINGQGWICLAIALVVTLLAHTWAGWVWSWILREFKQPLSSFWVIQVYLKTNIAKYLPGNVWHYYGRISAVTAAGVPTATATLSVLLEPLLMAAAALLIVLASSQLHQKLSQNANPWNWQVFCLVGVLLSLHPWFLNPVLRVVGKLKGSSKNSTRRDDKVFQDSEFISGENPKSKTSRQDVIDSEANPRSVVRSSIREPQAPKVDQAASFKMERYPLVPILGEIGFLVLRGLGFLLIFVALSTVSFSQIPMLLSAFSLAWLAGLVIPGAPGGIGVFEATAIALLNQSFSTGLVLSVVALYRFISILAETIGAGIASFDKYLYVKK
ncbi:MAG TPA: YbhN family protein [Coleofasciculaceae cyanobacterium]|jgi:hypothetical protein